MLGTRCPAVNGDVPVDAWSVTISRAVPDGSWRARRVCVNMFTVCVEKRFSAVHRVRFVDGTVEPAHGHDWMVRAYFARVELDAAGMVIDFGEAQAGLRDAVTRLHHTDLNTNEVLHGLNPTAEVVAKYVFDELAARGLVSIRRVEVTEAPGCVAMFEPIASPAPPAMRDPRAD